MASVFYAGAAQTLTRAPEDLVSLAYSRHCLVEALRTLGWALGQGWRFAVPLLAILVTHELGHYVLARRHRVPASLPMFVPFPNQLGTMGAVISMHPIGSRNALVDIGAAGPLAGLLLAIPITAVGLALSPVEPLTPGGLPRRPLYSFLKRVVCGPIPHGYDVQLHPVAFAGWTGLFMTMLNLLPVGQLDGGHITYALGPRADRWSRWFIYALFGRALRVHRPRHRTGSSPSGTSSRRSSGGRGRWSRAWCCDSPATSTRPRATTRSRPRARSSRRSASRSSCCSSCHSRCGWAERSYIRRIGCDGALLARHLGQMP